MKDAKPSGLFSIEEVAGASAGYPREQDGCDLCQHCRLRRSWPGPDDRLSSGSAARGQGTTPGEEALR